MEKGLVHSGPQERSSIPGETEVAVAAKTKPISSALRASLIALAKARDGNTCWLCNGRFERSGALRVTLEHLTPRSHGGGNDHDNIFLAHQSCNVLLGDMTRKEKIRFRRSVRRAARPSVLPAWHRSHKDRAAA